MNADSLVGKTGDAEIGGIGAGRTDHSVITYRPLYFHL
ncbi:hypothetical protein Poly59_45320 [Rubripirellula reticaptiva]|uniref:Uncharacterized protein n=1 Tax=Rubripirellula reticaptiva TaxID=2528013 RepID=A0A5C6EJ66_9BACT|nr:hypothetical protein Poly59_45320 [Rubripirellula reticaptiva]